MEETITL